MDSKGYWDKKIIEWEDSMSGGVHISPIERLASKFRKPLKVRRDMCFELLRKIGKDRSILELGCGSGFFALKAFKEIQPKRIIGVDISRNAILRAKKMKDEMKLSGNIEFVEGDTSSMKFPEADIVVGLGFLDYLTPAEIKDLFNRINGKPFIFTFSEKKFDILRFAHIAYLISQRCPKHYYYTKKEIRDLIGRAHGDVKIISNKELRFGCIVHNIPDA